MASSVYLQIRCKSLARQRIRYLGGESAYPGYVVLFRS